MGRRPAVSKTGWRLKAARAALAWERLWAAFWPAIGLVVGFAIAAGFDLSAMLPGWLHLLTLLVFLGGLGAAGFFGYRRLVWPDRIAATRRLEQDSGLAHRPLTALADTLADGADDPFTRELWAAHRRRMAADAERLRPRWPGTTLLRHDPYGLRAVMGVLLVIAVVNAGSDFWPRLGRALSPDADARGGQLATSFDLWINPPAYTGLPPLYLGNGTGQGETAVMTDARTLEVPAGSTVLAQLRGDGPTPQLVLDDAATDLARDDVGDFALSAKLGMAHRLAVVRGGRRLVDRAVHVVADKPPTAAFASPLHLMPRGALRLDYRAVDDYGVKDLTAEITRVDSNDPPLRIALPVPTPAHKEVHGVSYQDLTSNPWAGYPVEIRLIARDALNQEGTSPRQQIVLPERTFRNPVAQAIIAQRKLLKDDPDEAEAVAEALSDISARPDTFNNDTTVFLALRVGIGRLLLDPGGATVPNVATLLWNTALRVEDGNLPETQQGLRQAQQALQDALDRGASEADVERLLGNLRQAIGRYLRAMIENAQKNGETAPGDATPGQSGGQNALTLGDIGRLLDQAQETARSGSKDAARAALAQLQDMLESLKPGRAQAPSAAQGKMMRDMRDLLRDQQQLLDRGFRQSQAGQAMPGDLAGAQEALRRQLGAMMGRAGNGTSLPPAFGRAEQAMRAAVDALNRKNLGEATAAQAEALDQLRQAAQGLAEQAQAGAGTPGEGGHDPFGRGLPGHGMTDGDDTKIPGAGELGRSRAILDELRRRAADRDRPQQEQDYIERLLQRF